MTDPLVRLKRSAVAGKKPTTAQLLLGELGLNTFDAELYTIRERSGVGTDVVRLGSGPSVTNIIYVTKDGSDTNTGLKLGDAKATVRGAVAIATTGSVIKITAGDYIEDNPIVLPPQVSIVGESLREVSITPQNQADLFYVSSGNYIENISFVGPSNPGCGIVAFNPNNITEITQSPYVRNCTNFIPNSIGMKINGNHASGYLKSMVTDSYTQFNAGGIGVSITNGGYAQLVSLFTICCDTAIYCGSGGACDLTNSNSSFGNYGLVADGVSELKYAGILTSNVSAGSNKFTISGIGTNRPFDGQVAYLDKLFYEVKSINVGYGGTGYAEAPVITISQPESDWGVGAQAIATVKDGSVVEIDIVSNGRGYLNPPTITLTSPDSGISTATASATMIPKYYVIESATQPSAGICTVTLTEQIPYSVGIGSTVSFFKQSRILGSGHSFEYIGSGTSLPNALPAAGGVPIQANEVDMRNGGLVVYTSTDQGGNYRIGDGVLIDQATGTISGNFYVKSLFSNVTPFILALGG